jgi:TonB-linked SusC/RagA family outer membrane protein
MTKDYYIQFVRTLFPERLPLKLLNKTKLTCLALSLSIGLTYASSSYAQSATISLNITNQTVADVLETIEKQSDFNFFYNGELVDVERKVSVNVQNEDVYALLDQLFEATDVAYKVVDKDVILSVSKINETNQNKKIITGTVVDIYNEPIIGANIIEKGTTNGTITDIDGRFTLEVPENAEVQISYIGYNTQKISVNGKNEFNIALKEDSQSLDELVVVGYGTAKKSDLAGSVVRADLSALQESPNISLGSALQGISPGLNVGAVTGAGKDPEISIRGRTSLSGSNSPLIVLDGIIFRGSMVDINMNDVASVDILKDASAAAIYGSEASSGVILITSKIGKVMSKPTIEYSGSFSYQQAANKNMMPLDRDGFLQRVADRFIEESRTGDDLLLPNPNWDPSKKMMTGTSLAGFDNGVNTDWYGLLTNDTPYIQSHNLSVRGKSELSSYFFSMGYTDQQNLVVNDTYKRYNVRVNLDTKVTDWFNVGVQSFFTSSDYSGVSPSVGTLMTLPPVTSPYDEDGEVIDNPYKTELNPLLQVQQDDVDKRYNLFANFYADIDIPFIKGFNYRLNFSQNLIFDKKANFDPWGATFTGLGTKSNSSQYNYTVDNIFTYKRIFGKHDVNATFVYGLEKRAYEATGASAQNFANDILGFNNLESGQADLQRVTSDAWEESSLYGMLRLMYTFDAKYSLTATVRRDGFSGFGSNHKFAIFPSAAVAWRISEEDFFRDRIDWVDNLKLRASYGSNGNRTVGRYQTLAKIGFDNGYLFGDGASAEQMQWMSSLANSDLKWETTNTMNFAVDYSVLEGRLFGTLEYYHAKTNNLLFDINIPQMNGLSSVPSNIGEMSNNGLEFTVTAVPIETKDFSWDVTFNFSRNRNKINSILGVDADGNGKEDDLISNKIFMDHPYGVHYDYNIIGMWQIADKRAGIIPDGFDYGTYKVEDINGDNKYTADEDRKILGYSDPGYRFSIQNSFRYKAWGLKFFINSIQGGKDYWYGCPGSGIPNPDLFYQSNGPRFDYWTPENPDARYRQVGAYTAALGSKFSPYIQRNFVRLQDLTVSYNVPSVLLKKLNINRLKLYVTGKNLFTITDWDGWDPETGDGIGSASPLMRSYSVGLNLEF